MNDLNQFLRQWRDIEPRGNFEANVHRRIRQATPTTAPSLTGWFWGWGTAGAAGLLIGIASGLLIGPTPPAIEQLGFRAPHTLTGALGGQP